MALKYGFLRTDWTTTNGLKFYDKDETLIGTVALLRDYSAGAEKAETKTIAGKDYVFCSIISGATVYVIRVDIAAKTFVEKVFAGVSGYGPPILSVSDDGNRVYIQYDAMGDRYLRRYDWETTAKTEYDYYASSSAIIPQKLLKVIEVDTNILLVLGESYYSSTYPAVMRLKLDTLEITHHYANASVTSNLGNFAYDRVNDVVYVSEGTAIKKLEGSNLVLSATAAFASTPILVRIFGEKLMIILSNSYFYRYGLPLATITNANYEYAVNMGAGAISSTFAQCICYDNANLVIYKSSSVSQVREYNFATGQETTGTIGLSGSDYTYSLIHGTIKKYLFQDTISVKKWNGSSFDTVSGGATEANFLTGNDESQLPGIDYSQLIGNYKQLAYTTDLAATTINVTFSAIPKPQLVVGTGDITWTAATVEKINSIDITANGKVRIVASLDSGATWIKYNTVSGLFETVALTADSVKTNGNTAAEVAAISTAKKAEILANEKIRFAYCLYQDLITDTANTDVLSMNIDAKGTFQLITNHATWGLQGNKVKITFNSNGLYKVNIV